MGPRPHFDFWQTTRFKIPLHRPLVMGILNVTPDSFSAQETSVSLEKTIEKAARLVSGGADILDVGGESTRPGATPLTHEEEWTRVRPVLEEVLKWNIPISIDTYHANTMKKALDMGVDIVNDVHALRTEGALDAVSQSHKQCGICLMHMHGKPMSMQLDPIQGDVFEEISNFFDHQLDITLRAGVSSNRIVIDPGIGFGKTVEQNFKILRDQQALLKFNLPLLIGWSRKSSLGAVTGLSVEDRLIPSVAAALIAVQNGASIVRVHDVLETQSALKVWSATVGSPGSLVK